MDAKTLAKSKRAHSLHHSKKHHPNPTSKAHAGSATASSRQKPSSKPEKQKSSQSPGSRALPSNWDRYEDENDPGLEDLPHTSTSQPPDVIVPKSKGADYGHLISEAKAQAQSYHSVDSLTFLNDIVDEFNQGLGPLLSTRGQQMVSRSSDDNFLLDDKESCNYEAPFLSLNLHFLAEQLEKANLAERLFIEPDLLADDQRTESQSEVVENPDEDQAGSCTKGTEGVFDGLVSSSISDRKKGRCSSVPTSSRESLIDHSADSLWNLDKDDHGTKGKLTSDQSSDPVTERQQRFDAGAAEAELDLLLDSLTETKFFVYSEREPSGDTSFVPQEGSSIQSKLVSTTLKHVKEGDAESSQMVAAKFDDDIDDLLNETSDAINVKRVSPLHDSKATSIDDLLNETSDVINTKSISPLQEAKPASSNFLSAPHSDSKSKVLDDFDSWLDTI